MTINRRLSVPAESPMGLTKRGTPRKQGKSARGTWSQSVALDRRHRPQTVDRPSSTVRREWARAPQEAHLLDEENSRYRRLTVDEIAILQGFDPSWFDVENVSDWNRTCAAGDSVPPPLAKAVIDAVVSSDLIKTATAIEVCAGAGGLASASAAFGLRHVGLFEHWEPATHILRTAKPWASEAVRHADVREADWSQFRGGIGLLSGGPPCQPWSLAGRRKRTLDDRDLLGTIHEVVAAVAPEVFVFENVPGLISDNSMPYLHDLLSQLRSPADDLSYGVLAGAFQAADFGVPQKRRRVFLIGLRDRSNAQAHRVLDRIHASRTHRSPHIPDRDRRPWVTVGEALAGRPDPGGWRRWTHQDGVHQDDGGNEVDRSAAH